MNMNLFWSGLEGLNLIHVAIVGHLTSGQWGKGLAFKIPRTRCNAGTKKLDRTRLKRIHRLTIVSFLIESYLPKRYTLNR